MTNQYDEAIVEEQTAIRLKPDDSSAHYALGTALDGKGDHQSALAEFRKACDLGNSDGCKVVQDLTKTRSPSQ
jgi:Flp pilus assembly protein TadD